MERNLLNYVLQHRKRHPDQPCLVPQRTCSQTQDYLRAIHHLEDIGCLTVQQPTPHYRTWILTFQKLPPT